jgi:hypothetical protein
VRESAVAETGDFGVNRAGWPKRPIVFVDNVRRLFGVISGVGLAIQRWGWQDNGEAIRPEDSE